MGGVASDINEVSHNHKGDTTADARDVENSFNIAISGHHLVVHSSGNWGNSEVLTLGRAAHLDLVSTEELDLFGGGSPGSVEDGSHRSCGELSVVSDKFFQSILISLDGVKGIGTEKKGVAW